MTDPWEKDPDLKAAMEAMYGPSSINEGEGFLHHLKANPSLLDPAPIDRDRWAAAMDLRVRDEVHSCLRCGKRATIALIAQAPDQPRFLDLCFDCRHWLGDQMHEADMRPW